MKTQHLIFRGHGQSWEGYDVDEYEVRVEVPEGRRITSPNQAWPFLENNGAGDLRTFKVDELVLVTRDHKVVDDRTVRFTNTYKTLGEWEWSEDDRLTGLLK